MKNAMMGFALALCAAGCGKSDEGAQQARVETESSLEAARDGVGLDRALLESKLCAFGATPFRLERLELASLKASYKNQ